MNLLRPAPLLLLAAALLLNGCGGLRAGAPDEPPALPATPLQLRPLGAINVPRDAAHPLHEHLGGISGMDYDAQRQRWILLSDDRSEHAPARAYTARIDVDDAGLHGVTLTGVVPLQTPAGTVFPSARQSGEVPDPEALRIDPLNGHWVWASEGDPDQGFHPFVRVSDAAGRFIQAWPLPANLRFGNGDRGARPNRTVEGLAFSPDGRSLWVSMEAPLLQDGPEPRVGAGAWTRISRIDRHGAVLGQYAYPLDAVPIAPSGGRFRADNGISDIVATEAGTLLVVERSGREVADGEFRFAVRVYEASAAGASDVQALPSLQGAQVVPMTKRLLIDLNQAGLGPIDNIEALAWGPRLANGHATLLLISDDNFSKHQVTQVLAFEVMPGPRAGPATVDTP